jgi:hypothetical protein
MALLPLDAFADATAWTVTAPGGGASDRVAVSAVAGHREGRSGIRLAIQPGSTGHRVELTIATTDLDDLDDLQLFVRADRPASPEDSFALELALGSTAVAIDAPANRWRRLVPVPVPRRWQVAIVTLTDLAAGVRAALRRIRFTVTNDQPGTVDLSGLAALRYDLLGDVEAALIARLDAVVELDGAPVHAVVAPDLPPGGADAPHLRIRPLAVRPAPERERSGEQRTDFTATGFALRSAPEPVDLDYAVDAVAGDRAGQRALVEAVVARIAPVDTLLVLDRAHTMTWTGPVGTAGDPPVPSAGVRVATARRAAVDPAPAIPPFNEVRVEVEHGA